MEQAAQPGDDLVGDEALGFHASEANAAAPSTSAVMSFTASARPMPLAESERQVEKARAWRSAPSRSCRLPAARADGRR